jgi:hypothetical protein
MPDQLIPSVEDTHLSIFPVSPLSINAVLLIPAQTVLSPVTLPATVGGDVVTVMELLRSAQLFTSCAVIIPPVLPGVTVIILVPAPETIVHPEGTVHAYVLLANAGIEYTVLVLVQAFL